MSHEAKRYRDGASFKLRTVVDVSESDGLNHASIIREIVPVIPELNCNVKNTTTLCVGNRFFKFLIDTGASVSILNGYVIHGLNIKLIPIMKNRLITSISGQPLPVAGTAHIEICFAHKNIVHEFVVCEDNLALSTDGLLGTDFLSKHEAEICYARNEIKIGSDRIKIASVNENAATSDNKIGNKQTTNVLRNELEQSVKDSPKVSDLEDQARMFRCILSAHRKI